MAMFSIAMFRLTSLAMLLLVGTRASAQLMPAVPRARVMPDDLPMHSVLYEAEQAFRAKAQLVGAELVAEMQARGLAVFEHRVQVEIVGPEGVDAADWVNVADIGGVLDRTWQNRIDAWVPPGRLIELARSLPAGFMLERASLPQLDQVAGQGPDAQVVNSAGYRDGGANGAGMVIAVIDTDWTGLTAARANGDAPAAANTTLLNYTPAAFETGPTPHGTGCVETVFDHCPGAMFRLYKVDSDVDVGVAVGDAIANGVDVISHSMSWYNQGWADDSGAACDAANAASNAGMLFVTSAGNRAQSHWQGGFNPGAGDANWHDWASGDEALSLTVAANNTASIYLSWNTAGGTFNYDLYLYDATLSTVLASSTNGGNGFEEFHWVNMSPSPVTVHLAVWRASGGITELEVFGDNETSNLEYLVAVGSTTSPSNAHGPYVISVGAVTWSAYAQPNGSNPIAGYSSRGPSNSGMILPDLVGPTDNAGFAYGAGGFGGTSAATPNVAGALCDFWSDQPQWTVIAVDWLAREQARLLWRDWGVPGSADNVYGLGPCRLVAFAANTTWVFRPYGNVGADPNAPYFTVAAAQSACAIGGRVLIFGGGNYPEPITLNKQMTVDAAGGTAVLGQ
jgi:hypothetical protein